MEDETSLLRLLMEENTEEKYMVPPLADGPWLITTHENRKSNKLEKQTFRTNTGSYIKTVPELHRNIIVALHRGWLILRNHDNYTVYSLWNPVTSQFLRLPELTLSPEVEDDAEPSAYVLTESLDLEHNSETCMFVLCFGGGILFSCRPTLISGHCRWVKQSVELDGVTSVSIASSCVDFEGATYCYANGRLKNSSGYPLRMANTLARFTVVSSSSSSSSSIALEATGIRFPHLRDNIEDFQNCTFDEGLVECCGVVYFVHMMLHGNHDLRNSFEIIKTLVWRLDLSGKKWIRVDSLRNRAFLLSPNTCTWCWASPGVVEENCVYLAKDDQMYSYNLQDDTYTTLFSLPTSPRYYYDLTWFMPSNPQRYDYDHDLSYLPQKINAAGDDEEKAQDDGTHPPLLSELPLDILQSIGKRTILYDYMNLRATCKSFHQANPTPPQWRANNGQSQGQYPLFLFLSDSSTETYGLLDPFENVSRTNFTSIKSPNRILNFECCNDGWVLVRSGVSLEYYSYNSSKGEFGKSGKYPSYDDISDCSKFVFTTSPTSSDCLTLAMNMREGWLIISWYDAEDGEWAEDKIAEHNNFSPHWRTSPKDHKDACYFLADDGRIGEFILLDQEIDVRWKVYKHPFDDEKTRFDSCYLVDLDGELISVFVGQVGRWVKVFKFDNTTIISGNDNCWTELDTLGEHVVFVSCASSFSVKTEKAEMRNRIYLPWRKGDEIVFYSLDTRKYHTYGGGNSMDNLYGLKTQSSCCWIK